MTYLDLMLLFSSLLSAWEVLLANFLSSGLAGRHVSLGWALAASGYFIEKVEVKCWRNAGTLAVYCVD